MLVNMEHVHKDLRIVTIESSDHVEYQSLSVLMDLKTEQVILYVEELGERSITLSEYEDHCHYEDGLMHPTESLFNLMYGEDYGRH